MSNSLRKPSTFSRIVLKLLFFRLILFFQHLDAADRQLCVPSKPVFLIGFGDGIGDVRRFILVSNYKR